MTSRISIAPATPQSIGLAARRLREGALVAFATETVYGLGANALDAQAVARIFEAKGRPPNNPLIVHAGNEEAARQVVSHWPPQAALLAREFWPGPLTLVLPCASGVPDAVTGGGSSVGVRVPAHPVALALLREARVPIAAPSANRSEALSPTRAEHVLLSLGAFLDAERDMILDGGPCVVGIESSVLDLTQFPPVLLRPGAASRAQIEAVIGPIQLVHEAPGEHELRASPGMMARHYAPRARAVRFDSRAKLQATLEACAHPRRVGIITLGSFHAPQVLEARPMPEHAEEYASRLYAALHELDEAGCEEIWVEMPPEHEEWRAVRDRIGRATVAG